jgi:hypothetical protein
MLLVYRLVQIYASAGAIAAAAFMLVGLDRTVPEARGAYAFRPLLLPGLILLWPLALWRWWQLTRPVAPPAPSGRHYRAIHLSIWLVFAVLLPLLLLLAISLRQEVLPPAPLRLAAPVATP